MDRHIGALTISFAALKSLLKLPKDCEILAIRSDASGSVNARFEVLVEYPKLKLTPPYAVIPEIQAQIHTVFCPVDEVTHITHSDLVNLG